METGHKITDADMQRWSMEDQRVMDLIRNICKQGRNAEVKQNKDGTFKVYDVTKHIAI